jgi:hypothetical protein
MWAQQGARWNGHGEGRLGEQGTVVGRARLNLTITPLRSPLCARRSAHRQRAYTSFQLTRATRAPALTCSTASRPPVTKRTCGWLRSRPAARTPWPFSCLAAAGRRASGYGTTMRARGRTRSAARDRRSCGWAAGCSVKARFGRRAALSLAPAPTRPRSRSQTTRRWEAPPIDLTHAPPPIATGCAAKTLCNPAAPGHLGWKPAPLPPALASRGMGKTSLLVPRKSRPSSRRRREARAQARPRALASLRPRRTSSPTSIDACHLRPSG